MKKQHEISFAGLMAGDSFILLALRSMMAVKFGRHK
jgi:hypothetical protein